LGQLGATAMLVGYARVSTAEQDAGFGAQLEELKKVGCEKLFSEKVSSVAAKRAQLDAALEFTREDDVMVVKGSSTLRKVSYRGSDHDKPTTCVCLVPAANAKTQFALAASNLLPGEQLDVVSLETSEPDRCQPFLESVRHRLLQGEGIVEAPSELDCCVIIHGL
jgi:hypothetical protein